MFSWAFFFLSKCCSVRTRKLHNISFFKMYFYLFLNFFRLKIGQILGNIKSSSQTLTILKPHYINSILYCRNKNLSHLHLLYCNQWSSSGFHFVLDPTAGFSQLWLKCIVPMCPKYVGSGHTHYKKINKIEERISDHDRGEIKQKDFLQF